MQQPTTDIYLWLKYSANETFEIRCRSEIFARTIVYFEGVSNLRSKHCLFIFGESSWPPLFYSILCPKCAFHSRCCNARYACVGILALLQGTIKLRRSAAARRLTASPSPGDRGTLLDPPCFPSLPTGSQCPTVSTNPPQPARGVPRVRDPEVVEGQPGQSARHPTPFLAFPTPET